MFVDHARFSILGKLGVSSDLGFIIESLQGYKIIFSYYTMFICIFNLDEVGGLNIESKTCSRLLSTFNHVTPMLVGNMTLRRVALWLPF